MKNKSLIFLIALSSFLPLGFLQAAENLQESYKSFIETSEKMSRSFSNHVELGGIELAYFQFENGAKTLFCLPGQKVKARVDYQVDTEQLPLSRSHSVVIGLYPGGPQLCLIRSLGILNSSGIAEFTLTAPRTPGVYEVRCAYSKHLFFRDAKEDWSRWGNPAPETNLGVLIVQ